MHFSIDAIIKYIVKLVRKLKWGSETEIYVLKIIIFGYYCTNWGATQKQFKHFEHKHLQNGNSFCGLTFNAARLRHM